MFFLSPLFLNIMVHESVKNLFSYKQKYLRDGQQWNSILYMH